jgi:flavin-binding protein dodecin
VAASIQVRRLGAADATNARRAKPMADNIYKVVEVVGSSRESIADGARNAVEKASATLRNVEWFEIESVRGHVVDGKVDHFQVTTKIGFRLE